MEATEFQVMELITTAGESKAKAFEALKMVKSKNFDEARSLIEEARKIDVKAHRIQTELITKDLSEDEESPAIGLLMVHAQDHYMTSQLAKDLIETLIEVLDN
ncbi:PTS lactose/cellobiose transporter subunit IIA [Romboutsia weinsteinii]|uniref:PTS lactose/cellobiose transporter subunit IIA n=1 Tax=Romboutsia weinsteinii TaxID=2020949 RepID=A0A371IXX2_9FIRM|nr:PTS lactose/cellobiose transporter subunit IIA [Romboutsia weinsteinii]RDY25321.1 PTS lactose/cellobiose transporter subunit IIA [Romboutsia weinsteinii]